MPQRKSKYQRYPWHKLEVGELWIILADEMGCQTWASFRSLVSHTNKKTGKYFRAERNADGTFSLWRER